MGRITMNTKLFSLICFVLFASMSQSFAQETSAIMLSKPAMTGGKPLMEALKERQSTREFSAEKIPSPVLSQMLWAAFGINRPESGRRTAPTAMNEQEIDIYVATEDGLYLYDAKAHALETILQEDIRAKTGKQEFVAEAPVNLIYVADYSRAVSAPEEEKSWFASVAVGAISQNVYLYCASEGLVTVVRAWIDKPALAETMKLRPDQQIILSQTVGYPVE